MRIHTMKRFQTHRFASLLGCASVMLVASLSVQAAVHKKATPLDAVRRPLAALPIAARIRVPVGPAWLETGFGSVWVTDILHHQVLRIDPSTERVVARIRVGSEPELGLGVGFGSVWVPDVKDRTLTEIDAESLKVKQVLPVNVAPYPEGSIGVGEGGVWVITNNGGTDAGTLTEIDPRSGGVVADIPVHRQSHAVTVAFGSVWVTSTAEHRLVRIDPRTHEVLADIPMHERPLFLAGGEGSVWVLCQADGSLMRVDPTSNSIAATLALGVPGEGGDLSIDGGYVWVSAEGTPLTQIDPKDNRVLRQYVGGKMLDTLRVAFGSAWLVDAGKGRVWRVPVSDWH
jgi:streptogramin lyase